MLSSGISTTDEARCDQSHCHWWVSGGARLAGRSAQGQPQRPVSESQQQAAPLPAPSRPTLPALQTPPCLPVFPTSDDDIVFEDFARQRLKGMKDDKEEEEDGTGSPQLNER